MNKHSTTDKKYRIREMLDSLPYMERKAMFATLITALGVHPSALHRIMAIRADESASISVDRMQIIARTLGVTIDQLMPLSSSSHIKN